RVITEATERRASVDFAHFLRRLDQRIASLHDLRYVLRAWHRQHVPAPVRLALHFRRSKGSNCAASTPSFMHADDERAGGVEGHASAACIARGRRRATLPFDRNEARRR